MYFKEERTELQNVLNEYTYTCRAKLSELHLQEKYSNIEIDDHNCGDIHVIEKLYYKDKLLPICIIILWRRRALFIRT